MEEYGSFLGGFAKFFSTAGFGSLVIAFCSAFIFPWFTIIFGIIAYPALQVGLFLLCIHRSHYFISRSRIVLYLLVGLPFVPFFMLFFNPSFAFIFFFASSPLLLILGIIIEKFKRRYDIKYIRQTMNELQEGEKIEPIFKEEKKW